MKRGVRDFSFTIIGIILGGIIAFVSGVFIEKYAIYEHERIKRVEKGVLKQKIERENQVLIRRLEEDWEAFKDSITQVFIKKKKRFREERGIAPDGLTRVMEMRLEAGKGDILAKKRKEIDRKIEDLEMRLDF